jgi:hypothetical protein
MGRDRLKLSSLPLGSSNSQRCFRLFLPAAVLSERWLGPEAMATHGSAGVTLVCL